MNKILIDIDNKTPGAISRQIAAFLIPKCALHVGTNISYSKMRPSRGNQRENI